MSNFCEYSFLGISWSDCKTCPYAGCPNNDNEEFYNEDEE